MVAERHNAIPVILVDDANDVVVDDTNNAVRVYMVASDVSSSGGTSAADDADFVAGTTSGTPAMGVYESSPSSVTDGDLGVVGITQDRALRVNVDNAGDIGGGTQYTEDAAAASDPVGNALILIRDDALSGQTTTDGDNVAARGTDKGELYVKHVDAIPVTDNGGALTVDNGGTFATQVTGDALTALQAIETAVEGTLVVDLGANNDVTVTGTVDLGATDNAVLDAIAASLALIDNAIPSGNELQVDVVAALPAGTNNIGDVDVLTLPSLPAGTNAIGKLAANSGVDIGDVDVTSISAGTNAIGNVGLIGRTSGGMTIFRSIDLDESEEEVKATAGQVFSISAFNRTAAPLYLKFYNATAANTTVGTTTPVLTFVVPANADSDGAGFIWNNEIGFAFSTAICVACTTGVADNDTGAPGANDCVVNIGYT